MHIEIEEIRRRISGQSFWVNYLSQAAAPLSTVGLHLAIFAEPFMSLVLEGRKTVEARFSRNRRAPFGQVGEGDIILIKKVAGPICGLTLVKNAWFFDLAAEPLDRIKQKYGYAMCVDNEFWSARPAVAFATIIELAETTLIAPLICEKRDRRGWVSLRARQSAFDF